MKKIILFWATLTIATCGFAQQQPATPSVQWYSFEGALQLNAERAAQGLQTKKIFVDVYTDWCGWCKRMDVTTFAHPVIAKELNDDWIPVKLNAERRDTVTINGQSFVNPNTGRGPHQLAGVLLNGKMGYPSYALIDETGKPIQVISGYQQVPEFEMILDFFSSNSYRTTEWEAFQKTFKSEIVQE